MCHIVTLFFSSQLKKIFAKSSGDLLLALCDLMSVSWQVMVDDKITGLRARCMFTTSLFPNAIMFFPRVSGLLYQMGKRFFSTSHNLKFQGSEHAVQKHPIQCITDAADENSYRLFREGKI